MKNLFIIILLSLIFSCQKKTEIIPKDEVVFIPKIYTEPSSLENNYLGFNSVNAINKIADIENEYFNDFYSGNISQYYGTIWRKGIVEEAYHSYRNKIISKNQIPDSLHCTLYAYEGLKAGLDSTILLEVEKHHKRIWKDREIAGWSVGYILVKYYNWKAYLFLADDSHEYDSCIKSFQKEKTYPVWKQPNIPLEDLYLIPEENNAIQHLLNQHEFSWGFSDQGYHTWITRFNVLKECNWLGAPANTSHTFGSNIPLFIETPFQEYNDYQSHVLVFPPLPH